VVLRKSFIACLRQAWSAKAPSENSPLVEKSTDAGIGEVVRRRAEAGGVSAASPEPEDGTGTPPPTPEPGVRIVGNPDAPAAEDAGEPGAPKDGADAPPPTFVEGIGEVEQAPKDEGEAPRVAEGPATGRLAAAGLDRWMAASEHVAMLFSRSDAVNLDRKQTVIGSFLALQSATR